MPHENTDWCLTGTVIAEKGALAMHRIAELLFYCSVGNLKAVRKLVRGGRREAPAGGAHW